MVFAAVPAFLDGPPLAHTGGFGEPTCQACHFDGALNDPSGSLQIRGLPEQYRSGETYTIEVLLVKPGVKQAGFQASLRESATGNQAGTWIDPSEGTKMQTDDDGILYVMHTRAGAAFVQGDTARWQLAWRAPEHASDQVILHIAGNAADGDESPFGDAIYTTSFILDPLP